VISVRRCRSTRRGAERRGQPAFPGRRPSGRCWPRLLRAQVWPPQRALGAAASWASGPRAGAVGAGRRVRRAGRAGSAHPLKGMAPRPSPRATPGRPGRRPIGEQDPSPKFPRKGRSDPDPRSTRPDPTSAGRRRWPSPAPIRPATADGRSAREGGVRNGPRGRGRSGPLSPADGPGFPGARRPGAALRRPRRPRQAPPRLGPAAPRPEPAVTTLRAKVAFATYH